MEVILHTVVWVIFLKDKVPDFILEDSVKVQEGLLESNIPLE